MAVQLLLCELSSSRICPRQYASFLCSSHLIFTLYILLVSMVYPHEHNHSLEEISFYFIRLDFHIIAFHTFAKCMLTSLSVDEMLLPRYVNWSTNFRGSSLKVEVVPYCLKHMYSNSVLLPLATCSRLCSRNSACICAKCLIIFTVCICDSFWRVLSASCLIQC